MNVAYEGEQAEPLHAYRWYDAYFDERQIPLFIKYTIRQYRIFNPLVASCLGDLYQVVMRNGEKVKCYRSDDKLIEYDSKSQCVTEREIACSWMRIEPKEG